VNGRGLVPVGLGVLLVSAACSSPSTGTPVAAAHAAASTRPAAKQTCPDVAWHPPASVALEQRTRDLVPFGPAILGVQSTWQGAGFTVETVAGGYVDDLTEPYDDLRTTGTLSLRGDPEAEVMHGSLQGSPVLLVLWRDRSVAAPCDVHAFLVQGADLSTQELILEGLS